MEAVASVDLAAFPLPGERSGRLSYTAVVGAPWRTCTSGFPGVVRVPFTARITGHWCVEAPVRLEPAGIPLARRARRTGPCHDAVDTIR